MGIYVSLPEGKGLLLVCGANDPMPPSLQVATTSTPACFGVKLELHTSGWAKELAFM